MKVNIKNKIIIKVYEFMFKKALYDIHTGKQSKIFSIKGWRTFLITTPWGERRTTTPLYKILDKKEHPYITVWR